MLWTAFAVVIVAWLLGLLSDVGGPFVNLLLVVAGAIVVAQYLRDTGRV